MPTSTVTNLGHCRSDSADAYYPSTQPDLVVETHAIDDAPVALIDQPSGEILAADSRAAQRSISDERLTRPITEVAASIAPALADASSSLHSRLASWCGLHGLDEVSEEMRRRILARQAAYHHLLKATLYEYHHRHTGLPELPADVRTGFQTRERSQTIPRSTNASSTTSSTWSAGLPESRLSRSGRYSLTRPSPLRMSAASTKR